MAEISISQLPSAGALSSSNLIDIVQSGGNRKATLGATAKFVNEDNIIVSDQLPPETCNSGDLENYNKGKVYIYKTQSIEQGYILENIEENQSETGVWNLVWYEIKMSDEESAAIKRLQYYGDSNIEPSDCFEFGVYFNEATIIGIRSGATVPATLVIPYEYNDNGTIRTVTTIAEGALAHRQTIENVILPRTITSIEDRAFLDCGNLFKINLEDFTVKDNGETFLSLGNSVFAGCSSLYDVELPNYVNAFGNYIDYNTFVDCTNLFTIRIPKSIETIGSNAFSGCNNLTAVYFGGSKEQWDNISINSGNDALLAATVYFDYSSENVIASAISIHNTSDTAHEDIRDKFKNADYYGDINIEPTSTDIFNIGIYDNRAYIISTKDGVTLPANLVIPAEYESGGVAYPITSVYDSFLYNDDQSSTPSNIETIILPNTIINIDGSAFNGCSNLTNLTLCKGIQTIWSGAFNLCNSLTDVYYRGSEADWQQMSISEGNNPLLSATKHFNYIPSLNNSYLSAPEVKSEIGEAISEHNNSDEAHQDIRTTIGYIMHNMDISTFADVQQIVRQGFAKYVFKVGEQFIINESTGLSATIIDFDYDTPTDSRYTHSMTLQMTDLIYPRIPFSSPQAAWCIDGTAFPNGLESGQYYFLINNDDSAMYRNFTLTKTVPVGGIVCFNAGSNYFPYDNSTITTYASSNTTTPIESGIAIEVGNFGTPIPALQITPTVSYVNSLDRVISGNNSWKDSYIRAYLNNTGTNWWSPQGSFDYKPTSIPTGYLSTFAGTDFLSVIGTVYKKTQKIAEDGYGIDTTSDKFFLLSRPEVYGGLERIGEDIPNEAYDYYGPGRSSLNKPGTGADSNRIKYTNNIALTYGLRTPVASNNYQVRTVFTNGSISETTGADAYLRFAPACVIY